LKVQQQWHNQNTREKYLKVGGAEFVGSMLTQIRINRFQDMLAQITGDNFFSMEGQGQKTQSSRSATTPNFLKLTEPQ